jgi:hypothetical protein
MSGKNTAVFGIYATATDAERAVDTLIAAGFPNGDISVLMPDSGTTRDFAHEKDTKAPEGTTVGVTTGGVIGGALGVLVGMGALAIPGLGPLIAAGPIVADRGRSCRTRRRRCRWGPRRRAGRNGDSRIRGEALRGPSQERRRAALRALQLI